LDFFDEAELVKFVPTGCNMPSCNYYHRINDYVAAADTFSKETGGSLHLENVNDKPLNSYFFK